MADATRIQRGGKRTWNSYEPTEGITREKAGSGWNVTSDGKSPMLGGLRDATVAAVIEEAVAAVEHHSATPVPVVDEPVGEVVVVEVPLVGAASGTAALLAITGEDRPKVACICGGTCQHVLVTCLDCPESVRIPMPFSNVAAYERKHTTMKPGNRAYQHAVVVLHMTPSTDGLAGRGIPIV